MLYHVWICELKTPWMCKWLDTIMDWLVETDQEQYVSFFFERAILRFEKYVECAIG